MFSQPNINSLFFYHEFIGRNTALFQNYIKNIFDYDDKKICIDITRGADLSCYFDLSSPTNYPVIADINNKLIYKNPELLSCNEIQTIYQKYISVNVNLKYEANKIPTDLIIFLQLIQNVNISTLLIRNGIISLIRQFYTLTNNDMFNSNMWHIVYCFPLLKNKFKFATLKFNLIKNQIAHFNNLRSVGDQLNFNNHKQKVLENMYFLLKILLQHIFIDFNIENIEKIDIFINEFMMIEDKYKLISVYDNFIKNLI